MEDGELIWKSFMVFRSRIGEKFVMIYIAIAGGHIILHACFIIFDGVPENFEKKSKQYSDNKNRVKILQYMCRKPNI